MTYWAMVLLGLLYAFRTGLDSRGVPTIHLAMLVIGVWVGFLWGRALLRYQFQQEGWNMSYDKTKALGEGRFKVIPK